MSGREVAAISTRGLAIGWPGRVEKLLAKDIDLDLAEGELAILVGPNGSGKSTLLRTLVGLQQPLIGHASLGGREIRRLSVEERARLAACVFTDRFDAGYFSVFDIVAFGRFPYTDSRGRLEKTDLAAVEAAFDSVGLSGFAERRFSELSDGERQKALIARAIAQDCPLLVFDEPTAFLDAPARIEIFHLVRRLSREFGKAIVVSTHDIDYALRYADRLWLLEGNHRFSAGAPEDLARSGAIGRAFDGAAFRFDPQSGVFRSSDPDLGKAAIEVVGPEGSTRAWTLRLVERLGYVPAGPQDRAIARIAIADGLTRPLFSVIRLPPEASPCLVPREAASYEDLARLLSTP